VTGVQRVLSDLEALASVGVKPRIQTADGTPLAFSLVERSLDGAAVTLLMNESDGEVTQRLQINPGRARTFLLDPRSGSPISVETTHEQGRTTLVVSVPPRSGLILYEND
jgi:hypothetical protein